MSLRILGVDPGSLRTGWGAIEGDPRRPRLVASGVIDVAKGASLPLRLHVLRDRFDELVRRIAPDAAAVETPFHGINARAAFQLAHARGVLLEVLGAHRIGVVEYTPSTVKKAVTGNGHAEKRQVQALVRHMLGREAGDGPWDVADALGVALCHAATLGLRSAVAAATRGQKT